MSKSTLKDAPKKTKSAPNKLFKVLIGAMYCLLLFLATVSHSGEQIVLINDKELAVEIATTSQEKKTGLCCRESLPENAGMLFIYDQSGDYRFWMKDTKIPLDMIWIDSAKKIVHIEEKVMPSSYPMSFRSPALAQYILETNSGWVEKNAISIGDSVVF